MPFLPPPFMSTFIFLQPHPNFLALMLPQRPLYFPLASLNLTPLLHNEILFLPQITPTLALTIWRLPCGATSITKVMPAAASHVIAARGQLHHHATAIAAAPSLSTSQVEQKLIFLRSLLLLRCLLAAKLRVCSSTALQAKLGVTLRASIVGVLAPFQTATTSFQPCSKV